MTAGPAPAQGTLVLAWDGPSLPVQAVPLGPDLADEAAAASVEGVTGRPMALPPGNYLVRVSLPAWVGPGRAAVTVRATVKSGQQAEQDVRAAITGRIESLGLQIPLASGNARLTLRFRPDADGVEVRATLPSGAGIVATLDADTLQQGAVLAQHILQHTMAGVRRLSPTWLGLAPPADAPAPVYGASGDAAPAMRRFGERGQVIAQWNGRALLGVVPVDTTGGTLAGFSLPPVDAPGPGAPRLDLLFDDPDLNTLWLFMRGGALRESRSLAASAPGEQGWLDGELHTFGRSPLTATLEAYVLLRAGWRDELLAFTTEALTRDSGRCDLRVIQAELLGRMGKHPAAAATLVGLGCGAEPWPLFRPGIAYALARVRLYTEMNEPSGLGGKVRGRLAQVLPALRAISAAMDPDQLPLVLAGSGPDGTLQLLLAELEP